MRFDLTQKVYKVIIQVEYAKLMLTYGSHTAMIEALEKIVAGATQPVTFTVEISERQDISIDKK